MESDCMFVMGVENDGLLLVSPLHSLLSLLYLILVIFYVCTIVSCLQAPDRDSVGRTLRVVPYY